MNLDRLFHKTKTFAELTDTDLETFLQQRLFHHEHLNLEFKVAFPTRSGGKYDIREACKYIAGFSNEAGGAVVFGVADTIKDKAVSYPAYVTGLTAHPSLEDLSQWVTDRVAPLVQSPAIRQFTTAGKQIIVLKIPEGINRPYAYVDPSTQALTYFKKTAAGLKELRPDEVRDLYWAAIIDQSSRILRAGAAKGLDVPIDQDALLTAHRKRTVPLLEDPKAYGRLGLYCMPTSAVAISVPDLQKFMETHRASFSEVLRFMPTVDVFQTGVTGGYFPRAIRQDIKSTSRVTLYTNGLVAYDSQADTTMERDSTLHPYWLSYEIQRHLQLAKALIADRGVDGMAVRLELEHIEQFSMRFSDESRFERIATAYTGAHAPIVREVALDNIHDFDGPQRNIVFPAVKEILDEVCRIFGLPETPQGIWDQHGKLIYVKGLEGQR
jgi:hypothetical protein